MAGRLKDKVAIVIGRARRGRAGQRQGHRGGVRPRGRQVLCVDRVKAAAEETVGIIKGEGNEASAYVADVTKSGEIG